MTIPAQTDPGLHPLERHVLTFLQSRLSLNDTELFVAVSGGLDSMTLLYILLRLHQAGSLPRPRVVHVDHAIRGADSDADAEWVAAFCRRHKLELIRQRLNWPRESPRPGEDKLREARYKVFEDVLKHSGNGVMLTAHHLDDQLETVLMRLFRGSHLRGLGGIPARRGPYLRPLLDVSRKELDAYARLHAIQWREDASNADTRYLRNAIRHNVLPIIAQLFGDDFPTGIKKSIADIQAAWPLLERYSLSVFQVMIRQTGRWAVVSIRDYMGRTPLEKRLFWNYCFSCVYPVTFQVSDTFLAEVERFLKKATSGREMLVGGRVTLFKGRHRFALRDNTLTVPAEVKLNPGADVKWGAYRFTSCLAGYKEFEKSVEPDTCFVDGDALTFPLTIRSWQKGDRFRPLGMTHFKKVSDFFTDIKLDPWEKETVPVLMSGNAIVWLVGLRLDDRYKITRHSKSVYKLKVEQLNE
ncbi:MAG: tRNA lysidine(34) synthetase TilS [Calditrichaeota bacterium]|nr:MAG: tRNA lysidine(34) synthetase TilS [Calditrichota bacterium]